MTEEQTGITFERKGLSGWIRLFSDSYKAAVLLAATFIVGLIASSYRPEYPIYVTSGFLGGLLMLRYTDAARLISGPTVRDLIRKRLDQSGFKQTDSVPERWTPPLPRFLRWRDAVVEIQDISGEDGPKYRITGPYSYLARLSRGLEEDQ